MNQILANEIDWLRGEFAQIYEAGETLKPSELAERIRYLKLAATADPGPFSFDLVPAMREILDCFDPASPIQHVTVMKGVQVAFTTAVLENVLLFYIYQLRSQPVLFATADEKLAKKRIMSAVVPMIQDANLQHLIASIDQLSKKQGKTDVRMSWKGGGFMDWVGATSPNNARSIPYPCVLLDEVDGWIKATKDGDPVKLFEARATTFHDTRKILIGSTPTIKDASRVETAYKLGDQRKYFARCLRCGEAQILKREHVDRETGEVSGLVWETLNGILVPESVRYRCRFCGYDHEERDKVRLLGPDNAEWRPTAKPVSPERRSYQFPSLISLQDTWLACVQAWLEANNGDASGQQVDLAKLQVYYNNKLAEPFALQGQRVSPAAVNGHRRHEYALGQIPNRYAERVCGSRIMLLTAAVDVHGDRLHIAVMGWTKNRQVFLIEYTTTEQGNPREKDDPKTWGVLNKMLEEQRWVADDGREYTIGFALVDSQFLQQPVFEYCAQFAPAPIFPIKGRAETIRGTTKPFVRFETPYNAAGFHVVVDFFKDRMSSVLRRVWLPDTQQLEWHFNAPINISDDALKELTREYKAPKKFEPGKNMSKVQHVWIRPSGAKNELWDLLIYNTAAIEIMCSDTCEALGHPVQDWSVFWAYMENLLG